MSSTIVSFAKTDIVELIPGLQIANYNIPTQKGGSILVVEDSFYYKPDVEGNQDLVHVPSAQIAESVVHMHIGSQLGYAANQHPAIFAIRDRALTLEQVEKEFTSEKIRVLAAQRKWFIALVRMADDDWQVKKAHLIISDIQRIACRELGLKREWLTYIDEEAVGCPFCGSNLLNPDAPICPTCGKVHNPSKLAALEAKFSKVAQVGAEAKKAN